jgi:TMEM175 potassium channel family protein
VATTRLAAFSDGVLAIAATLLILDVHARGEPLGHALLHSWPSYAAYATSFATIGIIWVNHHTVIDQLSHVDRRFLFINLFFLMVVAFIPFPTQLVAEHIQAGGADARDAALTYGFTCTFMALAFGLMWLYAVQERRLLRRDADHRTIAGVTRSFRPGVPLYLGSTLIAFASPAVSVAGYAALAAFYVLESSVFARSEQRA